MDRVDVNLRHEYLDAEVRSPLGGCSQTGEIDVEGMARRDRSDVNLQSQATAVLVSELWQMMVIVPRVVRMPARVQHPTLPLHQVVRVARA